MKDLKEKSEETRCDVGGFLEEALLYKKEGRLGLEIRRFEQMGIMISILGTTEGMPRFKLVMVT